MTRQGNPKDRPKFRKYRKVQRTFRLKDYKKNIAGDDQVTPTIAKAFEIYIYEIA